MTENTEHVNWSNTDDEMLTREYVGIIGRILRSHLYHVMLSKIVRFSFRGRKLRYFCHRYNATCLNERIVEIPIVLNMVNARMGQRIIEIGNVLPHYTSFDHDVLDKYETGNGVINQDILSFAPKTKYDIALCISTLEHIGWDENPNDTIKIYIKGEEPNDVLKKIEPEKILIALDKIKSFLNEKGKLIVTLPTGYNPHLDELISNKRIHFDEMYCMKRISWSNTWKEESYDNVKDLKYNGRYPRANGLIVGIINC